MTRMFRCDYCGSLVPANRVELYFVHAYDLEDPEDELVTTGIYCGEPCAASSAGRAGSNRGGGDPHMTFHTGQVVGPVNVHRDGIRYGVVAAPEPSERIQRLLSD